jgi:hypothetical protein
MKTMPHLISAIQCSKAWLKRPWAKQAGKCATRDVTVVAPANYFAAELRSNLVDTDQSTGIGYMGLVAIVMMSRPQGK